MAKRPSRPIFLTSEWARRRKSRRRSKAPLPDSRFKIMLSKNVCEVVFVRKHYDPHTFKSPGRSAPIRRMLCTADWNFLNKYSHIFKYKRPNHPKRPSAFYRKHRIAIVWDLIRRNWRMINLQDYIVLNNYTTSLYKGSKYAAKQQESFVDMYQVMLKKYGENRLISLFDR